MKQKMRNNSLIFSSFVSALLGTPALSSGFQNMLDGTIGVLAIISYVITFGLIIYKIVCGIKNKNLKETLLGLTELKDKIDKIVEENKDDDDKSNT